MIPLLKFFVKQSSGDLGLGTCDLGVPPENPQLSPNCAFNQKYTPKAPVPSPWSLVPILFLFFSSPLFAQTAVEIENFTQKEAITFAEATRWVYAATGLYPLDVPEDEAMNFAKINKEIAVDVKPKSIIKLRDLSLLIMRAYGIQGGLMYRLIPSRRYAFRELVYNGVLEGSDDPSDNVTGKKLIEILSKLESGILNR